MRKRLDPARESWMTAPETRTVMQALTRDGGTARFVGGAVRNALLGLEVGDVDIATPLSPQEAARRLNDAHIKTVPTGIEHGTLTAVAGGKPFEVTTLRRDVTTDGRRATVAFTSDWAEDARRRDFTMNALYASTDGEIFDYVGGLADLEAGRVRFVGDPRTRIREDYLRILRLFRFHAWYGRGEVDAEGLAAAVAEKSSLARLSGERVQKEMLRLLEAENPAPVLAVMTDAGILQELLPGRLAVARLARLCRIDAQYSFAADGLLRLAALFTGDAAAARVVAERWKLSNAQRARLEDLAEKREALRCDLSDRELRKWLYALGIARVRDRAFLDWADDGEDSHGPQWRALIAFAGAWQKPQFALTGREVMAAGVREGPLVGEVLAELEQWWIDNDFTGDESLLAERLKSVVRARTR